MLRDRRLVALLVGALVWSLGGVYALGSGEVASADQAGDTTGQLPLLENAVDVYSGLGTWVDMYDSGPWRYPRRAVARMSEKGVRTLYLETANYRKPKTGRLYRPRAMAALLDAAHEHGIAVVAWYVPGFADLQRDLRRAQAALDFETDAGQRFDSFALDIEATVVRDIETRNQRARRLSRRIREIVGPDYALGAIVPEAGALYWPDFPYKALAEHYDAFLPMAYYSYRTSGARGVYAFVADNIRAVRRLTGNADIPVHLIGGIAEDATAREVGAQVRAAVDKKAFGTSLYDFPTTRPKQWERLSAVP